MMQNHAPSLWYVLIDTATGGLYVDTSRYCYAYPSSQAAEQASACPDKTGSRVAPYRYGRTELLSDAHACGADSIVLYGQDGQMEDIQIQPDQLRRRYYNPRLVRDVAFLHRYKRAKDLADLASCVFIVPVRIDRQADRLIHYAAISSPGHAYRYLAFSDLEGFRRWNKTSPGWQPLAASFPVLCRIGRKHGFLLDADRARIVLTPDVLDWIQTNREEEKGR